MQYCLLMHYQEGPEAGLTEEDMKPAQAAFARYADDLDAAGVLVGTQVLQSASATTTYTARTGTPEIQDGPFADTRERLGGVFVIEVPDLDAALGWAQKCPAAAWGSIEIRPVAVTYGRGRGWYTLNTPVSERLAQVVGQSYGRLLALLAAQGRDIAAAEDALADAMERALQRWPRAGVPGNPEAWLLTVARNRLRDMWKSPAYRLTGPWTDDYDVAWEQADPASIPDRRLELMLVCAHPAIAADIRTPLMLQTVLGVDAAVIAAAFAVAPATMAQRLVRAKKRIRDTGIPFTLPERVDLDARLPEVLEAVYGAYSIDWLSVPQGTAIESLASEALHLALVLVELLPDEPEVLGLAALMCLCEARRPARLGPEGDFVALDDQSRDRWDADLYARGEDLLARAHALARPGRFQYEAAIQSAHCAPDVDRHALRKLYRALMRVGPSLGAGVALAALDGEIDGAAAGLRALDAITDRSAGAFQPAWVTRGHLLAGAGRVDEAAAAYRRAIELTTDNAVRAYLTGRLESLRATGPAGRGS